MGSVRCRFGTAYLLVGWGRGEPNSKESLVGSSKRQPEPIASLQEGLIGIYQTRRESYKLNIDPPLQQTPHFCGFLSENSFFKSP